VNAAVTINFAGGTASTDLVQVLVEHAQVALGLNEGVATGIDFAFTNISICPGAVSFATAAGGTFDGTLTLALQWSGQNPAIMLNNLVPAPHGNPATITWPTTQGQETQILTPGTPLTLSGITGS
jgi:hypothetical protein